MALPDDMLRLISISSTIFAVRAAVHEPIARLAYCDELKMEGRNRERL